MRTKLSTNLKNNIVNNFHNKWFVSILILSFLSLFPAAFLVYNLHAIKVAADPTTTDGVFIRSVLTKGVSHWTVLTPLIIGIITWTLQGIISSIAVIRKQVRMRFAILAILLGGLGLHIFFVFDNFNRSIKDIKVIVVPAMIVSIIAALSISLFNPSFEDPYSVPNIELSTDIAHPNLIEVFTDGMDREWVLQDRLAEDQYKDFYKFRKFRNLGTTTSVSVPLLYDGINGNPLKMRYDEHLSADETSEAVYGGLWLKSGIHHFAKDKDKFDGGRYIVNPITLSNNKAYSMTTSGTPRAIIKRDPGLKVINWVGAKDGVANKMGAIDESPDGVSYDWLCSHIKPQSKPSTGSYVGKSTRVFMADLITHRPFLNDEDGKFTNMEFSIKSTADNLNARLSKLIASLKSVVGPNGKTAYDASMIVFYGDHASHERTKKPGLEYEGNAIKTNSYLMIKYPNDVNNDPQHAERTIEDRYVYSFELNDIIKEYFSTGKKSPLDINDHRFDNHAWPVSNYDGYFMAKYDEVPSDRSKEVLKPVYLNSDKSKVEEYPYQATAKYIEDMQARLSFKAVS